MHFLGSLLSHAMCCLSSRKYSTPPVTADTLCPRGIRTECFEKLVSSIPKGAQLKWLEGEEMAFIEQRSREAL